MQKSSICLLLIATSIVASCATTSRIERPTEPRVCFQGCFDVEIASTEAARTMGLMYRENLPADRGMLFVFDKPGRYRFWMKNTKIPLDMIWMDSSGRVTYISADTPPCVADPCPSYGPEASDSIYVLEVNAGLAAAGGIAEGKSAIISYP